MINQDLQMIIENNPIVIATTISANEPNAIVVEGVKVVDQKVLITDNYMSQTKDDIKSSPNTVLIFWDKDKKGYKMVGQSTYYTDGPWLEKVKALKENIGFPAKGAIVFSVRKIIKLH